MDRNSEAPHPSRITKTRSGAAAKRCATRACHLLRLLRLAAETCARAQELFGAEWREFDLDRRIWRVPSSRSGDRPRVIPLTDAALRALKAMTLVADPASPRVFHAAGSVAQLHRTFPSLMRRMRRTHANFNALRAHAIQTLLRRNLTFTQTARILGLSESAIARTDRHLAHYTALPPGADRSSAQPPGRSDRDQ